MKLRFTENFDKKYAYLDPLSQNAIDKAIDKFLENPKTRSLRIKKVQGCVGIFEMSANMDIRITFHYEKPATATLRTCGHHKEALKDP